MSKVILKSFISFLTAGLLFFVIYFWNKDSEESTFFFWVVIAFILGYYFISPRIMVKKKMAELEKKIDAVIKRFK